MGVVATINGVARLESSVRYCIGTLYLFPGEKVRTELYKAGQLYFVLPCDSEQLQHEIEYNLQCERMACNGSGNYD